MITAWTRWSSETRLNARRSTDPHDREDPEGRALEAGVERLADRHRVDGERDDDRGRESDERRPVRLHLQAPEQYEQHDDRYRREDRGQAERIADRIKYLLVHASSSR
jgi:hypothetical protein